MLIEILVLGRDEGLDDALGNGRDGHVDASLAGELGNQGAVIGVDAGHHRRLVFGEHFVVRQLLRNLPQHEGGSAGDGDERNHAGGEHEAEEAQEKSAATAAPPLLRRLDWSRNVHGSVPSRPPLLVARGTRGNPSQDYGNKKLPSPKIEGCGQDREGLVNFRTARAQRAWQNSCRWRRRSGRPSGRARRPR